jgi:tRNA modification GTPase
LTAAKDTICALSSGQGRAGVAVIRMSGPGSGTALRALCGPLPPPRHASLRKLLDPRSGDLLDRGLVVWLPAPSTLTGEDVAELHVHGGRAVVARVIAALLAMKDMRLAEPGEFARRAFENGKLDLTAVEGLADLINAETEAQAKQALAQAEGGARALCASWREELIKAQALAEASLDFADEGDVAADAAVQADALVAKLHAAIGDALQDRRGERLRDGFRVVIAGPPNVGKSSLLNALARRDVAIVSEEAGTTRDVIEVRLDLGGFPVILMDTAGIREAAGAIEQEGIRRALDRAREADLVLWIADATAPGDADPRGLDLPSGVPVLKAINKIDIATAAPAEDALPLSIRTGEGLDRLIGELTKAAETAADVGESPAITRARHRRELERCAAALCGFLNGDFGDLELRAEDLRTAAAALGRLTGRVDVEDILDKIFADFCIGK